MGGVDLFGSCGRRRHRGEGVILTYLLRFKRNNRRERRDGKAKSKRIQLVTFDPVLASTTMGLGVLHVIHKVFVFTLTASPVTLFGNGPKSSICPPSV